MNLYEDQKIYNSLLVLDNELNILGKYKKNKLVPFGKKLKEYLPFFIGFKLFTFIGLLASMINC